MSFKDLYERRQTLPEYISRDDIIEFTQNITGEGISIVVRGLNTEKTRGFFLSARNSNHPLIKTFNGNNLIFVARDNNRCWTRLVIFKEAMHCFDSDLEQTSSPEDIEQLINEFVVESPDDSPMMDSEVKALWMGLSLIMKEEDRVKFAKLYTEAEMTDADIAKKFRMPKQFIPHIFSSKYKQIIQDLIM